MKENHNKDYVTCLPILIIAVITLLTTIAYGFTFSSNDDGLLRAIASGAYTGKPDAHLIYIMYPLGLILKLFYTIIPAAPWYDLLMTGLHLYSWYLLILEASNIFSNRKKRILAISFMTLFLMAVDFKYLVLHQYTVLAGLLFATGLFLLTTVKEFSVKALIRIGFLLTISLWLRKEVFLMGLPILALLIFYKLVRKIWQKKAPLFITAGILLSVSLASFGIDFLAYASSDWKAFKAFNQARTQAYDYFKFPEYTGNEDLYESQNIGPGEYEVLAHMLDVSLSDDLTTEKLQALSGRYDEIMKEWEQFYSVPKKIIKDTGLAILNNDVRPAADIMFVLCLLVFVAGLKSNLLLSFLALAAYGYRVVFTAYFVHMRRFPERVSYGLFLMIACMMAGMLATYIHEIVANEETAAVTKLKAPGKAVISTCFLMLLMFVAAVANLTLAYKEKTEISSKAQELEGIYNYCKNAPSNLYLLNTYTIAPLTEKMFSFEEIPSNCIIMGNWTSHSPLEELRKKNAGIDSFETALAAGENVFLVERSDLGTDWIDMFYQEKKLQLSFESCDTIKTKEIFSVLSVTK